MIDAFHLETKAGQSLTARKETKQRGSVYWVAYKRVDGRLHKKYLGDGNEITLTQLEAVARSFVEAPEPVQQEQPQTPPHKPTFKFTNSLPSALSIFGFPTIPTKATLLTKYRALVKQQHPDKDGIHQDMVAINLAYDFLKRYVSP